MTLPLSAYDLAQQKMVARSNWSAGDYAKWAVTLAIGAQQFVQRLPMPRGISVLDVACGDGNAAIPAAQFGAHVVALDIAPPSVRAGHLRAKQTGVHVQFMEGDAELLPFANESFDTVIGFFGAVFTPRPELTADGLLRVCKPGGLVAVSAWTGDGFMGQLFDLMARHNPAPLNAPVRSALWNDEAMLRAFLGSRVKDLTVTAQSCPFIFDLSAGEVVDLFFRYNGPMKVTFDRMSPEQQVIFVRDMQTLFDQHNRATGSHTAIAATYREIVFRRAG